MKKWNTKKRMAVVAVCVLLLSALLLAGCKEKESMAPGVGTTTTPGQSYNTAPDFTVYDKDGNAVHLSDYIGKPVVLNFWASWCGPCRGEMPDFQKLYLEYGEEVQFLLINLTDGSRETVGSASDFIASQGYTFPVFFDKNSSASNVYGVRSIPVTYFIDAQGNLVAQATGAISEETLRQGIGMITGE